MKKRNINIDLIKCIAVFSVISVHFFKNTNFYTENIIGTNMYLAVIFRTLFMICVPLFIIATGYLMKDKILSKKYYLGIFKVLIIYLLDSFLFLSYKYFYLKETFNIKYIIVSILNFYNIGYSWYIEMYIGLFLLIPFINLIYNNLINKKQKQQLILTMIFCTSLPGLFNYKDLLIPDWWINLYPLTYYFIGCYIKEYGIKISKFKNIFLFLITLLSSSLLNIYISNGNVFNWGIHNDWGSIFNVLTSVLVFIFIINLNLSKINKNIKKIIIKISELSLAIYLTSSIADNLIYVNYIKDFSCNIKNYLFTIPLVLLTSIGMAIIIEILYKIIDKSIINKIKEKNNRLV